MVGRSWWNAWRKSYRKIYLKKRLAAQDLGEGVQGPPGREGGGLPHRGVAMGGTGKIAIGEDPHLPDIEIDATKRSAALDLTPPGPRPLQEATHPTAHQAPPGGKAQATAAVNVSLEVQAPPLCPPRAPRIPSDDVAPLLSYN